MLRRRPTLIPLLAALCAGGCAGGPALGPAPSARIRVVAAESFWASIARQLVGARGTVQSVVANPALDPHSYEPSAMDARALASAQLVIFTGAGYDAWTPRLLSANPVSGRAVLEVGHLFALRVGDNPHRWYDPAAVPAVARAIAVDLERLDPADGPYFAGRLADFQTNGLSRYRKLIASIAARYAGVPVGASESIFALLAPSLGLRLLTPPGFMRATSEGNEASARDLAATQRQIAGAEIGIWIYNPQNATAEIQQLTELARRRGIPITTLTETISPPGASFQDWQVAQLQRMAVALHRATGR